MSDVIYPYPPEIDRGGNLYEQIRILRTWGRTLTDTLNMPSSAQSEKMEQKAPETEDIIQASEDTVFTSSEGLGEGEEAWAKTQGANIGKVSQNRLFIAAVEGGYPVVCARCGNKIYGSLKTDTDEISVELTYSTSNYTSTKLTVNKCRVNSTAAKITELYIGG